MDAERAVDGAHRTADDASDRAGLDLALALAPLS